MYEQITNGQFEEIMEKLDCKSVWVNIFTDVVCTNTFYEEFEFISFVSGKYQFGHREFDDENAYQNISIKKDDILEIHRDNLLVGDTEHIILDMVDLSTRISIEWNY